MEVVVLADEKKWLELKGSMTAEPEGVTWVQTLEEMEAHRQADVFMDLEFEENDHLAVLTGLLPKTILVNNVVSTNRATHPSFIRFNGWTGFLHHSIIEAACSEEQKTNAEAVFALFGKSIQLLPDEIGFVKPRVISLIINEAFLALEDDISTKEEINTAMKMGTNYPFGPFEWADKIGTGKIVKLLEALEKKQAKYKPSSLIKA